MPEFNKIELVSVCNYLGFKKDDLLSLKENIQDAVKKKTKKETLIKILSVETTFFLPIVDYGDVLFLNASVHCLCMLD